MSAEVEKAHKALKRIGVLTDYGWPVPMPREFATLGLDGDEPHFDVPGWIEFLNDDEKLRGWYGEHSISPRMQAALDMASKAEA